MTNQKPMKNIVQYSGGKDSTALLIWAVNKYGAENVEVMFCDTGWEAKETYDYISYVFDSLGVNNRTLILKNKKYERGMIDLAIKRGRFPSSMARFCTQELKVIPAIDYILSLDESVTIYQGIRKDESEKRSHMNAIDDYFLHYITPYGKDKNGKDKYHTYRRAEVLTWLEKHSAIVSRPLFTMTAEQVFDMHKRAGIEPNPLYKQGFSRVGCFPCIMCTKSEIKIIADRFPERIQELVDAEAETKSTFFPPEYIPERFRSTRTTTKSGDIVAITTVQDVVDYVSDDKNQLNLFPESIQSCSSVYNICE